MAYKKSDILKAVTWYRDNGRNLTQTAAKYKVSKTTITRWLKENPDVLNANPLEGVIAKIEHGRAVRIEQFEKKQIVLAENVCQMAYERIIELIPKEKSIFNLVNLIEKLDPRMLVKTDDDKNNTESALDRILANNRQKWQDSQIMIEDVKGEEV